MPKVLPKRSLMTIEGYAIYDTIDKKVLFVYTTREQARKKKEKLQGKLRLQKVLIIFA